MCHCIPMSDREVGGWLLTFQTRESAPVTMLAGHSPHCLQKASQKSPCHRKVSEKRLGNEDLRWL